MLTIPASDAITTCTCPACVSADFTGATPGADYTGTRADNLESGYKWANSGNGLNLNFKFHTGYQSYWGMDTSSSYSSSGMSAFSGAQQAAVRDILTMISSFTKITFTEVTGGVDPQIGFVNANATQTTLAGSAYYPTGWQGAGDVFINKNFWGFSGSQAQGSTNYFVLMHEIGHALGLEHSFNRMSGEYATEKYSVMAYDMTTWGGVNAGTYMLYDIGALQDLYGANTNYHAGDDVYTLNTTTASTIWDGGGTDTLDGSALTVNLKINLNAGEYSSIGLTDNLAIAYNARIENALGGSGNDIIIGNAYDNVISCGAGDDMVYASAGNDTVDGGAGNDTLRYTQNLSEFVFSLIGGAIAIAHNIGTTTATGIENFIFGSVTKSWADLLQIVSDGNPQQVEQVSMSIKGSRNFSFLSAAEDARMITGREMKIKGTKGNVVWFERDADGILLTALKPKKITEFSIQHQGDLDVTLAGFKTVSLKVDTVTGSDFNVTGIAKGSVTGGDGDDHMNIGVVQFHNKKARGVTIDGGDGDDTIVAVSSHKTTAMTILGGNGDDHITFSGPGSHQAFGGMGNDTIHGGQGHDRIDGGDGHDHLYGGAGNDQIFGGAGQDFLYGEDGIDTLWGGDGDDYLFGGAGNDILYGGAGNDIFALSRGSNDSIRDFVLGEDRIDISQVFEPGFDATQSAIDDFLRVTYSGGKMTIAVDANGGGNSFEIVANVSGNFDPGLSAADLVQQQAIQLA